VRIIPVGVSYMNLGSAPSARPESNSDLSEMISVPQSRLPDTQAELVRRACTEERETFYEWVHPYEQLVYAIAIAVLKNPADAEGSRADR
jgi:hypothetical protein